MKEGKVKKFKVVTVLFLSCKVQCSPPNSNLLNAFFFNSMSFKFPIHSLFINSNSFDVYSNYNKWSTL